MENEGIVNRASIDELANFIESTKYAFDMNEPNANPKCGSAGCIGGHAAVLWPHVSDREETKNHNVFSWDEERLAIELGISDDQANELCYPGNYNSITRDMAVQTLRRLALTGEVDWKF